MKKHCIKYVIIVSTISLLLQGCTTDLLNKDKNRLTAYKKVSSSSSIKYKQESINVDVPFTGVNDESINNVDKIYYGYWKLSESDKKLYQEIYDILVNMKGETVLTTLDNQAVEPVFSCVMADHPELFYVEGYKYTKATTQDVGASITFSGNYIMSRSEMEKTKKVIDKKVNECISNIPKTDDEYEVVKYLYEYIINSTEYDTRANNNQNICSVFLYGRSICQGYAKAFQYLLNKVGIQSFLVTGSIGNERHAWNLVKVNGDYYYADPTWGDSLYTYVRVDENQGADFVPDINYECFMMTTDDLKGSYRIDTMVDLPYCTARKDNYFVRECLFLEEYNEQQLNNIFNSSKVRNANYVMLKCKNDKVYKVVKDKLIKEQRVFKFIQSKNKTISFAEGIEQNTLSFWDLQ